MPRPPRTASPHRPSLARVRQQVHARKALQFHGSRANKQRRTLTADRTTPCLPLHRLRQSDNRGRGRSRGRCETRRRLLPRARPGVFTRERNPHPPHGAPFQFRHPSMAPHSHLPPPPLFRLYPGNLSTRRLQSRRDASPRCHRARRKLRAAYEQNGPHKTPLVFRRSQALTSRSDGHSAPFFRGHSDGKKPKRKNWRVC